MVIEKNIDLNNKENELGLTLLHQSVINDYLEITKKIINLNSDSKIDDFYSNKVYDINIQDLYSNTSLMYAITEKKFDHIELFINNNNLNYNLTNFYGETVLHLIFKNYDIQFDKYINKIVENTNLNIQDDNGITCLLYICKNNLLDKFKDILENKELNIFIKDLNDICPFDFIKKDDLNIIISSYYNNKNNDKSKKEIEKIIIEEKRSIPKIDNHELLFDNGIFINTTYYTGAPIDVLFGLLFIYDIFKNNNRTKIVTNIINNLQIIFSFL
jgi:ankyrin repeat protein